VQLAQAAPGASKARINTNAFIVPSYTFNTPRIGVRFVVLSNASRKALGLSRYAIRGTLPPESEWQSASRRLAQTG